jgi:hypothetical protein
MAVRVGLRLARKIKSCDVEGKGALDIGGKGALGRYKTWSLTRVKGHRVLMSFLDFGHFHVNGCAGGAEACEKNKKL